jgi:hypothetical protein
MTGRTSRLAVAALLVCLLPSLARAGGDPSAAPTPRRLDLKLLGGVTSTDGRTDPGLRFAEVAFEPAERVRTWLQYDGTLGLDSAALARRGDVAPAIYAGGLAGWGQGHLTRLEVGWRTVDRQDQALVRGEQVLSIRSGLLAKAGGWAALSAGRTEAVGQAAVSLAVTPALRLEPIVFVAKSAVPGERDVRLVLSADLALGRGVEVGGGLGAGRAWGRTSLPDGTVVTGSARASFPLRGSARALLLATHERPASGPAVSVLAAGFSLTAGR